MGNGAASTHGPLMLKRLIVWGVVAVAIVLAVQVLLRAGPPVPSLFAPPKMRLPALDAPKREPAETADRAAALAVPPERLYAEPRIGYG